MSQKQETISFKVDADLAEKLKHLPNRSDFIRLAVLSALDNSCPLCQGTGVLNPHQKKHWQELMKTHEIEFCDTCKGVHLVCEHGE